MSSASTPEQAPDFSDKISPVFAARLAKLQPNEEVRAIVLPVIPPAPDSQETMARSARREAATKAIADALEAAFREVDQQLALTGGRRLTFEPNRLGFILIQAPARTLYALAAQEWVRSLMEDQSIEALERRLSDLGRSDAQGSGTG